MYKRHSILAEGAAINDLYGPVGAEQILDALEIHVSSAPTTSGTLTVTRDSALGPAFDTVLYAINLQTASTTDVLNVPLGVPLLPGDGIRTTYTNADGRTIGLQFWLR